VPSGLDATPTANSSPSSPGLKHDSSGSAHARNAPRNVNQGFSLWDHSPLDAVQHGGGGRASRCSAMSGQPDDLQSLFKGTNAPGFGSGRGSGMNGVHGSAPGDLKLNQLTRGDLGMYLKSSMGSFRLSYQEAFGSRSRGLGGGVGQGSAGASFNSSTFGNGIFNLSAISTLGYGSTAGSSRGGFSSGSMSGAGHGGPSSPGGTVKQPAASVSLHLHF